MRIKDWYKENKENFSLSELNFIFESFGVNFPCLDLNKILNKKQVDKLKKIKSEKLKGIPLALSLGKEKFLDRTFNVSSQTLLPRPETELLTEKTAQIIKEKKFKTVLDLGCGSGCIGISLERMFPGKINVHLSDISKEALAVAAANTVNLKSKAQAVLSDLFSAFGPDSFDLVVANLPYVKSSQIKGSLLYEPKIALDGGEDGLFFIEKIINQAPRYLKEAGYLIMEFGFRQKKRVENFIKTANCYIIREWIKDYAGIWRGVVLENG